MPSRHTFLVKPIAALLARLEVSQGYWADPFAGFHSPAQDQNDLNPDTPAEWHMDALAWLQSRQEGYDGVLYDPPYSYRQASEVYKSSTQQQ
jgi:hypothetical protein